MTAQVETGTVLGSVTGTGNALVTVTANGMTGSPIAVSVPVTNLDTASIVAKEARYWLALDANISVLFQVSGTGANIVLTARDEAANDTTLNIAIDNDTCTGLTAAPTSTNTTAGVEDVTNGYATVIEFHSWAAVRGLAGAASTDTSDDSMIGLMIEAASRYIESQTGKRFYISTSDETRYYQAWSGEHVKIDDLATITSISVDYSGVRSYTALVSADYDLLPDNAALLGRPYTEIAINTVNSGAYFPTFRKGVQIIGKFGWPTVPLDIKEATLSIVQALNASRSGQVSSGRITVSAGGIVIRPEDVPAFAQSVIKHYRELV